MPHVSAKIAFANSSPLIEKISKKLTGWKAKAAQVIDLLQEKEKVRIMISNMSRQYKDSFYLKAMTIYDSLIEIEAATRIEQRDSWITGQKERR